MGAKVTTPFVLKHKSGSTATIYPHGATITSFKTSTGKEILFVSSSAKLDGSKAVRGGVPLVFPVFGPDPDKNMPQHGFLRNNTWSVDKKYYEDEDGAACCDLSLSLKDVVKDRGDAGPWSVDEGKYDCTCTFTVKLKADSMTNVLKIQNTGKETFPFQTLLHTYYMIDDHQALNKDACFVEGLNNYTCEDKITTEEYVQGEDNIIIDKEVDRIYKNTEKPELDVKIKTGKDCAVSLKAKASVGGEVTLPVSVVVWNPYIEKAKGMSDFTDEQYNDMICVEPGVLHGEPTIASGSYAQFEQIITSVQD